MKNLKFVFVLRTLNVILSGNNQDFGCYDINSDAGSSKETIPAPFIRQKVKAGGTLVRAGDRMYALKGGNTYEFWRYTLSTLPLVRVETSSYIPITSEHTTTATEFSLNVVPNVVNKFTTIDYTVSNTGKVTLKLYNANGRLIETIIDKYHEAGKYTMKLTVQNLAKGIHFLKYTDIVNQVQRKLIIN